MLLALLISSLSPIALADGACGTSDCPVAEDMSQALDSSTTDWFTVSEGQVTFDSEGTEGGYYHSRTLHWPGGASGVTIGRGYDMKFRTASEVEADMLAAGVDPETAAGLADGAGREGSDASYFANTRDYELTPQQQHALFETIYAEYAEMTEELICSWSGNSGSACSTLWDGLDPAIRTILVDLRYRGDLTSYRWSSTLKSSVMANDLQAFADIISDRDRWYSVPEDRFNRRSDFIQSASSAPAVADTEPAEVSTSTSTSTSTETSESRQRPPRHRWFRRGRR